MLGEGAGWAGKIYIYLLFPVFPPKVRRLTEGRGCRTEVLQ